MSRFKAGLTELTSFSVVCSVTAPRVLRQSRQIFNGLAAVASTKHFSCLLNSFAVCYAKKLLLI